jgi:hypothetical protein
MMDDFRMNQIKSDKGQNELKKTKEDLHIIRRKLKIN